MTNSLKFIDEMIDDKPHFGLPPECGKREQIASQMHKMD